MALPRRSDTMRWELVVDAIGPKVRALRRERGMTLQQLAHAADVSAAAVHKVERGEMVPTITTLLKIAGALGTPIGHFVSEDAPAAPLAVHTRAIDPRAARVTITGSGGVFRTSGSVSRVEPGAHDGTRRTGECLVVVLTGSLSFEIGDEVYAVGAGESLHFPTHVDHRWTNLGPAPVQAIWVTVPDA
ncbi:helix-turn-helix domain-containing protein [Pseudonocardia acidicola]|uniref:Helix-turn-helix transcriptional regulator n=1 Tax=Pseudonocardia acidicola TaxID=2724939 RepID=A0ABX1SIC4_9PSEU|nr:helix-turn-helix transcriptional regulator [Pseudonocardia acidicola]